MNYIELINQFWTCHKEHRFSPSEISLYFALLHESNLLSWKNPFKQSNAYLSATLGISEPTLIRARNILQQAGLIEFQSGQKKRDLSTYTLKIGLNNFSRTVSRTVSRSVSRTVSRSVEKPLDNYKHKQNETKDTILTAPTQTVNLSELQMTCNMHGVPPEYTEKIFLHFESTKRMDGSWIDKNGHTVTNPANKVVSLWRDDRRKNYAPSTNGGIKPANDKYAGLSINS